MNNLQGKVAIVTGASSGIGRATAIMLAQQGAAIIAGARDKDKLDTLVAAIQQDGGRANACIGDVNDESFAKALVDLAQTQYGRLDMEFNNAGSLGACGPTTDISLSNWHATISTNLSSAFLSAKYKIPAMLKTGSGSIVFTSSFVGYTVG